MITLTSHLALMSLAEKRVFVRADLNVPISHGVILDDYRLQSSLPTINLIHQRGGRVIIASHLGRPVNSNPEFSTRHLISWFEKKGYDVIFASDLYQAETASKTLRGSQILLLENLRFWSAEKNCSDTFAQSLKNCADIYVNDAFGTLHRTDTSISLLPLLFKPNDRTIGLLVEHELIMLNRLIKNPQQPFVLILGGGKVADKIPILDAMIERVQKILLCPAIVFTFLKAQGKNVGSSLVDEQSIDFCKNLFKKAQQRGITILMPVDYQVAQENFSGPLHWCEFAEIPDNMVGISIGKKTAKIWSHEILNAGTVFYNGTMGTLARPETLGGIRAIFESMAESHAFTVIGGGDSVAVAQQFGFDSHIDLLSTGGGATLTYLSGQELPGLQPFL